MRVRTTRVLALAVIFLTLACGACTSTPSQGISSPSSIPTATATSQQAPLPTPRPKSVSIPVLKPSHIWRSGEFQDGIQLYWHSEGSAQAITARADQLLNYIVSVGANSVGITFPIYTDGAYPTHVYAGSDTPTPAQLALVVAAAKQRDLRVMLRPTIDEVNIAASESGAWRGSIQPQDVDVWFASYDKLLLSYAAVATQYKVDEFVAGVELFSLQGYTSEWQSLQRRIRATGYNGELSYSINWDDPDDVPFTTLGLDAYPAIDLSDTATVQQLSVALANWLEERSSSTRSHLTIQEAGIPALSGMYPHPWLWGTTAGQQSFAIQANWFSAMCSAVKTAQVQGLYYWSIDSDTDLSSVNPRTEYSGAFIGRPAAASIKRCFSS